MTNQRIRRLTNKEIREIAEDEIPVALERLMGGSHDARAIAFTELIKFARAVVACAATAPAPEDPELNDPGVDHILRLAAIVREVDGKHDLSAAALAEAILAHPGFSGCHDGPVDPAAQGEVGNPWQPIETAPRDGTWVLLSGGECEFNEESDNKGRAVTARWTTEFSRWLFAYYDSGVYGEYENPTHWQPLLSPTSTPLSQ